ncbi:Uncharacterised protein [Vibrio cholerae]|nr:Uncharacterised protein [Vibrio cholerae]
MAHFRHASTYQCTGIGDHHELITLGHLYCTHNAAVTLRDFDRNHTLSSTTFGWVFR